VTSSLTSRHAVAATSRETTPRVRSVQSRRAFAGASKSAWNSIGDTPYR